MNNYRTSSNNDRVYTRSISSPGIQADPFWGGQYPGLGGNPYSDFAQGSGLPAPIEGGGGLLGGVGGGGSSSSSNLLGGLNFNQIKGFVDRMGGIEGIVGTMTKIQKMVGTFQQMAPMLKLLFSSFGGKAKTADLVDFDTLPRRRRKRRRRGKYGSKRRRGTGGYKARVSSTRTSKRIYFP